MRKRGVPACVLLRKINKKDGPMRKFSSEAKKYEHTYNPDWENEAHAQRGEFLRRFPLDSLTSLTLRDYAIGQNGRETFCYWVEPGTRKWALIVGATSDKFGVYHGKTKSDPTERFRYTKKFSSGLPNQGAERAAFRNVRKALVELVRDGESLDFRAIDSNPLSQMLKAKTLSLYFPSLYLPICSADNLRDLASALSLDDTSLSQIQHEAMTIQSKSPAVRKWSTLKYSAFLYEHVLGHGPVYRDKKRVRKNPAKQSKERVVDFEKLMKIWQVLGKKSEAYALSFERARLCSIGYPLLAKKILDRTKQPRYGYDFESFTSPSLRRFIEVKTFTPVNDDVSRFFLSANELTTASKPSIRDNYYFYLVIYGPKGEPIDCQVRSARRVLENGEKVAQNYLIRLPRIHSE